MEKSIKDVDFLDLIPLSSLLVDLEEEKIIYQNAAAAKLFGYSTKEVSGQILSNLIPLHTLGEFKTRGSKVENSQLGHHLGIFPVQTKTGLVLKANIYGQKISYLEKSSILLICSEIVSNDSHLYSSTQDLSEELLFNQSILENSLDCVTIMNGEGLISFMNSNSLDQMEIEGFSNYKNTSWLELWEEEYQDLLQSSISKAVSGKTTNLTLISKTQKGNQKWWKIVLSPVENKSNTSIQVMAVQKDITLIKDLEEKLTKSNEIELGMKASQRLAQLGTWYYDIINQVAEWSEETYRIWGLNPNIGNVSFEQHKDLVHPKDWERFNSVINHAIQHAVPYKMELELLREDGTYKTVNTIGAPVFDDNNKLIAFRGTTQDISDRVLIEKELKLAKEKAEKNQYAMAQASTLAKIGYCEHDFGKNTLSWSDYVFQLYGLIPSDEPLGYEEANRYFDKVSQEKIAKATSELKQFGTSYDLELKMINSKNEELFVRKVMQPIFNEKNEIIGERGVVQNITEGKHLQELNREVARMVKIGSWSVDLVEQKVFWSEQIHQLHETDPKSYIPTLDEGINFYRADFREMVQEVVENAMKTGEEWDFEAVIVTAKNNEVWVRSLGHAEFENGRCIRLYGGFQDINARKKAEEEKNRFQETLENSLNEIYMFDSETLRFSYVNKGALSNLGFTEKEVVNLTPVDIKPEFSEASFREFVKPLITKELDKLVFFTNHRRKDGSLYPVEVHLKLVEEINYKNFIAIILDITERKKAEEDLLSASERLRLATTSVKMGIWDWDVANDKLIWDDKMYELYGVERSNFDGAVSAWQNGLHPDDYELANKALIDAVSDKGDFHSEFRVVWPDGSIHYIEANAIVSRDETGKAIRLIGGNIDITERKKSEEEILRANERFEKVTEATDDAIWDWDIVNDIIYRSDAIDSFFGEGTPKTLGYSEIWNAPFHPEDIDEIKKSLDGAINNPYINKWRSDYRILKPNWDIVYVIDQGVIVRDENGKAIRIVGAMADITEQKLFENENIFKANLLKRIGQAAISTDLSGTINFWNKAAEEIYGWTAQEAIGKNIDTLIPSDLSAQQSSEILTLIESGKTWLGEFQVRRKNGTFFPVRVSNAPVYDEKNQRVGMIGISSDISEEKENQELLNRYTADLERSNKELEQFAYVASHDLQEPLRMVSSFMDQLQRKYGNLLDEKANQYIYFASDGAKRMKQIILELLEYSRVGRHADEKEKVDLNEIISEYKLLRRKIISEKSAVITCSKLPVLFSHKVVFTQIFHALLDNAMKYSGVDKPPLIEIKEEDKGKEWVFSVKDNGIGIDSEDHEKIFIIFQRLYNPKFPRGTGIGLSIAKKQVDLVGGKIWVDSVLGEGSTFYFTIPKTNE
ncbi:PAS domain S-box protein [Algoriphagus formosus]|uniref:PAS domain S-box protein n=1 Tax=Algoriphagus formosus TaxID=2007308 RepID=UPI000C288221|nr:PAS domain S-box protein [Algoriphagus formosus]